jgi:serine/threonine protein kinase
MEMSSPGSKFLGNLNKEYTIVKELDFGGSSKVYEVLDNNTGETKVAKIFDDDCEIEFGKEVSIFNSIKDLNCAIQMLSYGKGFLSMEEDDEGFKNYIILEYGKGNLLQYMEKLNKPFSPETALYLFYQFIKDVKELHQRYISHRDLKAENVLLVGNNLSVKLCDFGLSKSFLNENKQKIKFKDSFTIGSRFHYPPEILENKYYDGEKCDVYCAGITLFSLATRSFPFQKATPNDGVYNMIYSNKIEQFWNYIDPNNLLSPQFRDLFVKMVKYNPGERIALNQIFDEPYLARLRNPNEETLAYFQNKVVSELGNINIYSSV